jgi:hypothetical protein
MKKQKDEQLFGLQKEAAVIQADLEHVDQVGGRLPHPSLLSLQVVRELESPRKASLSSLLMDGENSNDTFVVPSLERDCAEPRDLGGFNLLADKVVNGLWPLCHAIPRRR